MFKLEGFYLQKTGNKNRSGLEIIRDMLTVATNKCRKTRILFDAHLNYRLLEKYLMILLENELLEPVDDSYYLVTSKGKNFLQNYEEHLSRCKKIIEEIKVAQKEKRSLKDMCLTKKTT